MIKKLP